MLNRILVMIFAACLGLALSACVASGPSRAIAPASAGLTEISPGLWTDDAAQADRVRRDFRAAQDRIAGFWGKRVRPTRTIICLTKACAAKFGLKPLGITYGKDLVILGPSGANATVIAHELSHIALHQKMTNSQILNGHFPAWFNEGLASFLSPDPRYIRPANAREADFIRAARSYAIWNKMVGPKNYKQSYGAAARLVQEIDAKLGRAGLRKFVDDVAKGADFETTLRARMVGRP